MKGGILTTTIFIVCLGNIPVTLNTVMENLSENNPAENSDDQTADEYELTDDSFQSNSKEDNLYAPSTSRANTHTSNKKCAPVHLADVNKAALDFFNKKKKTDTEEDMDLCFSKSLLPDMKLMTQDQKRRYKVQMINATSCILSEHTTSQPVQHNIHALSQPVQHQTQSFVEQSIENGTYTYQYHN